MMKAFVNGLIAASLLMVSSGCTNNAEERLNRLGNDASRQEYVWLLSHGQTPRPFPGQYGRSSYYFRLAAKTRKWPLLMQYLDPPFWREKENPPPVGEQETPEQLRFDFTGVF